MDFKNRVEAKVFTLTQPNRIVIDVPRNNWNVTTSDTLEKSDVKTIRVGDFQQDISRIVIETTKVPAIDRHFWLPAIKNLNNRLVIDYTKNEQTITQKPDTIKAVLNTQQATSSSFIKPTKKPNQTSKSYQYNDYKPLIVIDAGHGGKDSGAIAKNGLYEKTVVLKIAKELARNLEKTGKYRTKLTRENDRYIKLRNRVKIARDSKADLFISIHADSIENHRVSGASVYTLSNKASDKQTAKLAARENKSDIIAGIDLSTEDEDVTNILLDLVTRETTNQSKFFANVIVKEFKGNRVKTLERPHRHAGFAVLKAPDIPAILIETGFMSNKQEAQRLNDPKYRKHITESIAEGIDSYFTRLIALN